MLVNDVAPLKAFSKISSILLVPLLVKLTVVTLEIFSNAFSPIISVLLIETVLNLVGI